MNRFVCVKHRGKPSVMDVKQWRVAVFGTVASAKMAWRIFDRDESKAESFNWSALPDEGRYVAGYLQKSGVSL